MGRQIAEIVAHSEVHSIEKILDIGSTIDASAFSGSDAIIDFTVRDAFLENWPAMAESGVPVVVGTTGWDDDMDRIRSEAERAGTSMLYSANYSLGVNIFLRTVREAARLTAPFVNFDLAVAEQHHTGKADFPSGTALKTAEVVLSANPRKKTISSQLEAGRKLQPDELQVASIRLGTVFGVHSLFIDSDSDEIVVSHTAKNRTGFALGAVQAAEWLVGQHGRRPGFHTMDDFLNDLFTS